LTARLPGVPQVAVVDTTVHHNLPMPARLYAGPYEWYRDLGIRRFGFHGINHQYCAGLAAEMLGRPLQSLKIVSCHLGSGASLAAVKGGQSIMTTMGYTPLDGLMMATRSGSIDPGIILHLLEHHKYSSDQLLETLNKQSGLKGISGVTGDMKELLAKVEAGGNDQTGERARLAYDMYVHNLRMQVGSMIAVLNGLDVLVFTGGVGENSWQVRESLCSSISFVGVAVDPDKNRACSTDADISTARAAVRTLVIHANEELAIARQAKAFA
ncbi:MAG TPA: acetate/propionate family kinase, partial [Chroococcales cyanobacterium]